MSRPTPSESYADLGLQIAALMFHVEQTTPSTAATQPDRAPSGGFTWNNRLVFHDSCFTWNRRRSLAKFARHPATFPSGRTRGSVNDNRVGPLQLGAAVHASSTLPLGNSTPTNPCFSIITVTKLPGVVGWVKLQPKFLRKGVKTTVPDPLSAMRQTVVSGKEWCS